MILNNDNITFLFWPCKSVFSVLISNTGFDFSGRCFSFNYRFGTFSVLLCTLNIVTFIYLFLQFWYLWLFFFFGINRCSKSVLETAFKLLSLLCYNRLCKLQNRSVYVVDLTVSNGFIQYLILRLLCVQISLM